MNSFALLQGQTKLFEDDWRAAHEAVMQRYELADQLAEHVAFITYLSDRIDALSKCRKIKVQFADQLLNLCEWWHRHAGELLSLIDDSENEGFSVENADELREQHQRRGSLIAQLPAMRRAISAIRDGQSEPSAKVFDELRDSLH